MTRMPCIGRDSVLAARFRKLTKAVRRNLQARIPRIPLCLSPLVRRSISTCVSEAQREGALHPEARKRLSSYSRRKLGFIWSAVPAHGLNACSSSRPRILGGGRREKCGVVIYLTPRSVDFASFSCRNPGDSVSRDGKARPAAASSSAARG
ncbi:hypothetical protein B0J12DRAFT_656069 [Macrophomina phaseolina]|uniref:Uncharacterized protein n=1 Tax=Macrophomina phaseolina TaxID=35725 RepID=A0ABQ8GHF3_9PEZI|nr:hypothetical protein B0J12DRAFT_656069 [Macrophomina phaseolina]